MRNALRYRAVNLFSCVRSHAALAWASNVFIESIQPLIPDSPSSADVGSQDFSLALHHLGFDVEDWDHFSAELARNGRLLVYCADVSGTLRFGYFDALEEVGNFLGLKSVLQGGSELYGKDQVWCVIAGLAAFAERTANREESL